jgi:hypothetical protein
VRLFKSSNYAVDDLDFVLNIPDTLTYGEVGRLRHLVGWEGSLDKNKRGINFELWYAYAVAKMIYWTLRVIINSPATAPVAAAAGPSSATVPQ